MKKMEAVKAVAALVVSAGVGFIVSNIVKATTPADTKVIVKICIGIGSFVLAGLVSDAATDYTEKTIDEAVEMVKDAVKEAETIQG